MGMVVGKTSESKNEYLIRHRAIEKEILEDKKKSESVLKILLLGARESGKSTIVKQMKILHGNGFNDEETERQKSIIYQNILHFVSTIVKAMDSLHVAFYNPAREADAITVIKAERDWAPGSEVAAHQWASIKLLWNDAGVKQCFARSNEYQLCDSAQYFLDNIDRISSRNYIPKQDDMIRARERTVGIVEFIFQMDGLTLKLIDVGGQRSERKKWIHCFEGVSSVIYVASLSEYNQKLFEDNKMNRMLESLKLFETIVNCRWFRNSAMLLFLNKRDIFTEKLNIFPLSTCFPEYAGDKTYEACSDYIRQQYQKTNNRPQKLLYCHKTCATDTDNVKFVMDASLDIILSDNLNAAGLAPPPPSSVHRTSRSYVS